MFAPFIPVKLNRPKVAGTAVLTIPGVEATGIGTAALTANTVKYEPFFTATPITIDQLVCEVTTPGAASTTIRLGIYAADDNGQPLGLIIDAGTVTADSNAVKAITLGTPIVLAPGNYLAAINSDGTPTLRCARAGSMISGFAATLGASPFIVSITAVQTYAAFPSTGLAATALNGGGGSAATHMVFFRVSVP